MPEALCRCGRPLLHYSDARVQAMVESLVAELGENVKVVAGGRSWSVPRHYIAQHGLKAEELPGMGFPEIV